METQDMTITQVVDVNNCREKAAMYTGMATAVEDKISKEVCFSTVWMQMSHIRQTNVKSVSASLYMQYSREEHLSFQQ